MAVGRNDQVEPPPAIEFGGLDARFGGADGGVGQGYDGVGHGFDAKMAGSRRCEKFGDVRALPAVGVTGRGVAELPHIVTTLKNRLHRDDNGSRWRKKPMKWRC